MDVSFQRFRVVQWRLVLALLWLGFLCFLRVRTCELLLTTSMRLSTYTHTYTHTQHAGTSSDYFNAPTYEPPVESRDIAEPDDLFLA